MVRRRLLVSPVRSRAELEGLFLMRKKQPLSDRFWSKVDKNGPLLIDSRCWIWTAGKNSKGYGAIKVDGRMVYAHRLSYEMANGAVEICVLHRCDNRVCCNPEHLFVGTSADNCCDRHEKNRDARGVTNGKAKLDPESVRGIRRLRRDGLTLVLIAEQFNVCFSTVGLVCRGEIWGHVQ